MVSVWMCPHVPGGGPMSARLLVVPVTTAATFCATLADEWARAGVTDAVVAPGSRSTPLALALAGHPAIRIHVHHDERSASFLALGLGIATRRPAVLLCSSGTAGAHFHAAVIEAHQAEVPLIVCTADRPPELRDIGAPQTVDQSHLFGSARALVQRPGRARRRHGRHLALAGGPGRRRRHGYAPGARAPQPPVPRPAGR